MIVNNTIDYGLTLSTCYITQNVECPLGYFRLSSVIDGINMY